MINLFSFLSDPLRVTSSQSKKVRRSRLNIKLTQTFSFTHGEEGDNKNQVGGIWGMASTEKEGSESERAEHM